MTNMHALDMRPAAACGRQTLTANSIACRIATTVRCVRVQRRLPHQHSTFGVSGRATETRISPSWVAHSIPPAWITTKQADSADSPFRELELMEHWDGTGKTRVRQHVNPLRLEYRTLSALPDWSAVFSDPSLPLALDIGSGYGRFLLLLQRHRSQQQMNYLGIEIRRALVDRSNAWAERLGVGGRVHYVFANATFSLETLLGGYPGPLEEVFIQFPDPHFKRRHHKRRVVQPELVGALRQLMAPGGRLLLQSDIEPVAAVMRDTFETYSEGAFELAPQHFELPASFSAASSDGCGGTCTGEAHSCVTSSIDTSTIATSSIATSSFDTSSSGSNGDSSIDVKSRDMPVSTATAATASSQLMAPEPCPGPAAGPESAESVLRSSAGLGSAVAAGAAAAKTEAVAEAAAAAGSAGREAADVAVVAAACGCSTSSPATSASPSSSSPSFPSSFLESRQALGSNLESRHSAEGSSAGPRSSSSAAYNDDIDDDYDHAESSSDGAVHKDAECDASGSDSSPPPLQSQWAAGGWLAANPVGVPTEREHYVMQQGLPVYRVLLRRV